MDKRKVDDAIRENKMFTDQNPAENASIVLKIKRERRLRAKKLSEELRYIDTLTHLTNREYFYTKAFTVLKSRFNRYNTHCILFIIDISNFKMINSIYGYQHADECLKEVAVRLLDNIESLKGDVSLSRTGSNEFALLIGSLTLSNQETVAYANHLVKTITEKFDAPVSLDSDLQCQLHIKVGISLFLAKDQNIDSMINEASLALQEAKKQNNRTFCFFDSSLEEREHFKSTLIKEFQNEAKQRILLYYQPIVDKKLHTVGYEVLSRWKDAQNRLYTADHFIRHFEESGHIVAFDKYVFEQAVIQLKHWQEEESWKGLEFISINISPVSFMSSDFLLYIPKILEKYRVDPKWIILEITENRLFSDFDMVEKKMRLLTDYGIRFALDDFGTGYSSLSYLQRLPFSELKIDKSLITDLVTNKKNRKIVSMILMMAETIGLKTIAEGIETQEQRDLLLTMGCDYMQGYLFDCPGLPIEHIS